jgi:hypothetical protein
MLLLSALPMRANQLGALHTLCWCPWLQRNCTLCGVPVPLAPVPRCARRGRLKEPYEGTWECSDEEPRRSLALAWTVCHHHICKADSEALWRLLDSKLRERYGFEVEESPCRVL